MSGSVAAQALNALMLPVLSRLYLPETFGQFGPFLAAVAVLSVIANLGYETTVMLPSKEEEAGGLLRLSLLACGVLTLALAGMMVLLPVAWLGTWGLGGIIGWAWLIPFSVGLEGVIQPYSYAFNRALQYKTLTRLRLLRAIVTSGLSVAAGVAGWGVEGLLTGHVGGQLVAAAASAGLWKHQWGQGSSEFHWWALAKKYIDFPRYGVTSAWLNVASKQIAYFVLPGVYGEAPTGQFSKAERILNLPPGLLSMTVGRVYFEEASQAARNNPATLAKLTRSVAIQVAYLGMPILLFILLWGPDLFAWVLGEPWRAAGHIARGLMPWLYLTMIASTLSFLIDIFQKLKPFLIYNLVLFVSRSMVLIWASTRFDVLTTVTLFGVVGAVMMALQIGYLLHLAGVWKWQKNSTTRR